MLVKFVCVFRSLPLQRRNGFEILPAIIAMIKSKTPGGASLGMLVPFHFRIISMRPPGPSLMIPEGLVGVRSSCLYSTI